MLESLLENGLARHPPERQEIFNRDRILDLPNLCLTPNMHSCSPNRPRRDAQGATPTKTRAVISAPHVRESRNPHTRLPLLWISATALLGFE